MKKHLCRVLAIALLAAMLIGMMGCGQKDEEYENGTFDFTVSYEGIEKQNVSSGVSVHDPSILKVGDTYYIYGSHMASAYSPDMLKWKRMSDGYKADNPVFGQIYSVKEEAFAYAGDRISVIPTDDGGTHVWAPDVIYNKALGKYFMYYCTTSTWSASNLCYGVSDSPEGPFEWKGALIYSGFTQKTLANTNVLDVVDEDHVKANYLSGGKYNHRDFPNAIDPSVFYDKDGRMWMVYGSWSGGMFILELDPNTGLVIHPEEDLDNNVDPYFGKRLLGGGHKSIEGPYILYDANSDYYYLFVSYGSLNATGGYQIRVFRSKNPNGEYEDMNGQRPVKGSFHENFGLKLSGNYLLPSLVFGYMATGHNSALYDDDGKTYIAYHTRFFERGEYHSPRVHQYLVNAEGWPCMLPYQTQGETVSDTGYATEEVVGRYYVINQGTAIDDTLAKPVIYYLLTSGKVVGAGKEIVGQWSAAEGTYHMNITIGDQSYSGVFCRMPDEAGVTVMTFSAVGNNESVWGVMYPEAGAADGQ